MRTSEHERILGQFAPHSAELALIMTGSEYMRRMETRTGTIPWAVRVGVLMESIETSASSTVPSVTGAPFNRNTRAANSTQHDAARGAHMRHERELLRFRRTISASAVSVRFKPARNGSGSGAGENFEDISCLKSAASRISRLRFNMAFRQRLRTAGGILTGEVRQSSLGACCSLIVSYSGKGFCASISRKSASARR